MERISILGCGGSGKSYVAKELGKIFDLPVIHFDRHTINFDGSSVEKDTFVKKIFSIKGDKWIMDGNHSRDDKLTQYRFIESDLIIFLDFTEQDCIDATKTRHGSIRKRQDIPDCLIENDESLSWLINHIQKWFTDKKPQLILSQAEKYDANQKLIVLKNRQQVDDFLASVKILLATGF